VASDFSPELTTELAALLSTLRAGAARLAALLEEQTVKPATCSTSEAAELARIGSAQSVRNWARKHGLGLKIGNRWEIDRHLLEKFLLDRHQSDQDAPEHPTEKPRASLL